MATLEVIWTYEYFKLCLCLIVEDIGDMSATLHAAPRVRKHESFEVALKIKVHSVSDIGKGEK
jgi:hypothetical protein